MEEDIYDPTICELRCNGCNCFNCGNSHLMNSKLICNRIQLEVDEYDLCKEWEE
jgi:hypothetical protein